MEVDARPHAPSDPAELAEALRPVLHRLLRALRRETIEEHGVTPLHGLLLVVVHRHPGIGVNELAARENLRGPTISGHVKSMEGLGLLRREALDPKDRRRVSLFVTDKGEALLAKMKRSRTDWLAQRLGLLTPQARQAIAGAVGPLLDVVG
jgi:DNA-binding MarR family transcriptional regulator